MPFSDDDLKQLKTWATDCFCTKRKDSKPCWHEEITALLARLEAAENAHRANKLWLKTRSAVHAQQANDTDEAWRKAAGR